MPQERLRQFVQEHFDEPGTELKPVPVTESASEPAFFATLSPKNREWAASVHRLWCGLATRTNAASRVSALFLSFWMLLWTKRACLRSLVRRVGTHLSPTAAAPLLPGASSPAAPRRAPAAPRSHPFSHCRTRWSCPATASERCTTGEDEAPPSLCRCAPRFSPRCACPACRARSAQRLRRLAQRAPISASPPRRDTYWVVEGLLASGLHAQAEGVVRNLLFLLSQHGAPPPRILHHITKIPGRRAGVLVRNVSC